MHLNKNFISVQYMASCFLRHIPIGLTFNKVSAISASFISVETFMKRMRFLNFRIRAFGLVAMIPALGAGGPGFKSRIAPTF